MIEFDYIANPKVGAKQKFGRVILEDRGFTYREQPRLTATQKVKQLIKRMFKFRKNRE